MTGKASARQRLYRLVVLAMILLVAVGSVASPLRAAPAAAKPKLVLLIVVDQLRGDMISRVRNRLGEGGFRYLLDNGVVFRNAHYRHAATVTCVGHATVATGGNPPEHGLPGNTWYSRKTKDRMYCVEDPRFEILGEATKSHAGTSPANLTASTIGDELVRASDGRSRVYTASAKDRGAILLGGQLGKAFWISDQTGHFITSSYYMDRDPAWLDAWNAEGHTEQYRGTKWTLLKDPKTYLHINEDSRTLEPDIPGLGRTFPHLLGPARGSGFFRILKITPMVDELTAAFAERLVQSQSLGQKGATDMLAVSFSATDLIGHVFGPDSLEAEDNILRLDRTLAGLFRFIDASIGLDNVLIVLTADHGIEDTPGYLHAPGGTIDEDAFLKQLNAALMKRFGGSKPLIAAYDSSGLYLDLDAVGALKVPVATVEAALAEEALKQDHVVRAYTRTDILAGRTMADPISREVVRAFQPARSGNVVLVFAPGFHVGSTSATKVATHGSPYAYDTFVPLFFAGPGILPETVDRLVGPEDIAPTIATYLGIKPPSGAVGAVLPEVTQPR